MRSLPLRVVTLLVAVAALLGAMPAARAIVGGSPAPRGAWSFTASLQYRGSHTCGAVVVNTEWVATAAHCVHRRERPAEFSLIIGRSNLDDTTSGMVSGVASIHVHPRFDPDVLTNDIALLRLQTPASVPPIPVSSSSDDRFEAEGALVRVTGWGRTAPAVGPTTRDLHEVEVRIVGDSKCSDRSLEFDAATEVCAGALLKDSCQGDSGGPLFSMADGRPWLVGLVSSGIGCATPDFPGIYTEVNQPGIRSWITSVSEA